MSASALDWSARRAALTPSRIAFDAPETGDRLTFADVESRVLRTARWLQREGVQVRDRVAVLAHNRLEYLELWLACGKLGAILQTLNWRLTAAQLSALVGVTTPKVLLHDEACAPLAAQASPAGAARRSIEQDLARRSAMSDAPLGPIPVGPDAPWVICHTGGSTGLPKGAVLTHRGVLFNAINTVISWGLDAQDVAILNAPLFHTGGLNVFTAPLFYAGARSTVCTRFEPEQVFDLVEGGATVFFGVPAMFQMLQAHPRWEAADFSCLKLVISGGAPCPAPIFERFFERQVDFRTGYGLTEAGPNNFWLPKDRVRRKPGCVGQPLMHVEARIVDDAGRDLGPGAEGELVLRGPHMMAGYYGDEAATRAAIDTQGWLHTGDLARVDEDGDFTICGRKKDLIISGGENIYPAQVESVLLALEGVSQAAVVGRADPRWGEVPVAFVVRDGPDLGAAEVRAHAEARLARYEVPKEVIFVDALPLTGPGKVDKRALAARLT